MKQKNHDNISMQYCYTVSAFLIYNVTYTESNFDIYVLSVYHHTHQGMENLVFDGVQQLLVFVDARLDAVGADADVARNWPATTLYVVKRLLTLNFKIKIINRILIFICNALGNN